MASSNCSPYPLYTEGSDSDTISSIAYTRFRCVNDCKDSSGHKYRFGDGSTGSIGSEYCKTACPTTGKLNWFMNKNDDKECTSNCPPPISESTMHVTTPNTSTSFTALFRFENTSTKQCMKDCNLHTTQSGNNDCLAQCANVSGFTFRAIHLEDVNTYVPGYQDLPPVAEAVCHSSCEARPDLSESGIYNFLYPSSIGTGHGLTASETICLKQCPPTRANLTNAGITFTNDTGVDAKLATFRYMKASDNKCYDTCSLWRDVTVNSFVNTRSCVNCCAAGEYIKTTADDSNNTVRCVSGPTASEYWY